MWTFMALILITFIVFLRALKYKIYMPFSSKSVEVLQEREATQWEQVESGGCNREYSTTWIKKWKLGRVF